MSEEPLQTAWLPPVTPYDGSQLRPHWIRRTTGLVGDALIAFRGPCRLARTEIADLEDQLEGPGIAGDDMLHFVEEVFDDGDIGRALLRQRLFAATMLELLLARAPGAPLRRDGDDLFAGDGKLSISVATRSLISGLMHFALNVTNSGTPVRTASLTDLGVEPRELAEAALRQAALERGSMRRARCQVRGREES